jgi:hypothetical protein
VVDADVLLAVVGRGDDEERALEVRRDVLPRLPADGALVRERLQLGHRVGRDEDDVGVARE